MARLLNWLDKNLLKTLIGFLLAFIPLWPKLPLVDIPHTWVYVRWEDIFIASAFVWWFILLLRKKTNLKTPLTVPIVLYWIMGGVSLAFTLVFTARHLANFFPGVAVLHFLRRIEYLGIFFLAFSTIKSPKDIIYYLRIIMVTIIGVVFYGLGQKFLGFPAFLTMNEEFAKGIPLYLSPTSRLSSTFAGHYDLAAYLVLMIAFLWGIFFPIKSILGKIIVFIVIILSLILLLFTASRVSFTVYLIAVSLSLFWSKKKILIIPVIIGSILLMSLVSGASERFLKTIRVRQVVYDVETGKPIATLEVIPKTAVNKEGKVYVPITTETEEQLPVGSGFISFPGQESEATTAAIIKKPVPQSLKMSTVSAEIATISGSFLIQKALVYDISFTTRFQGEWPRAFQAFKRNILFGSGYSSVGLATDNDYLRSLAETGVLGAVTFLLVFIIGGIFIRKALQKEQNGLIKGASIGLAGGLSGILMNAALIDVFEASKIAFSIWILSGIVLGSLALSFKEKINYKEEIKKLLTHDVLILILLGIIITVAMRNSFGNYFVGDDFTWLKWAAITTTDTILEYFTSAQGFFYRPLAKIFYFVLYNIFWLQPNGFHFLGVITHVGCGFLVYLITKKLLNSKKIALVTCLLFLFLAVHAESLFWISASAELIAPLFGLISFYLYIQNQKALSAVSFFFALLGHEGMIVFPLIIFFYDLVYRQKKEKTVYLLFSVLLALYLEIRWGVKAHWLKGDYSYNLTNLPLNSIGNFFAYGLSILLGPQIFTYFTQIREVLKVQKIIAWGVIVLIVLAGIFTRKTIKKIILSQNPLLIFAAGSFAISLFPYLGLGNTSERYAYFASAWAVIFLAKGFSHLVEKARNKLLASLIISVVVILLFVLNGLELERSEKEWEKAGNITFTALASLRNNFLPLPKDETFYIANLPIRYGQAWIFPVGFEDGLWHIFREESLKIMKVKTTDEGLELQKGNPNSHVFTFENYEIKEIK